MGATTHFANQTYDLAKRRARVPAHGTLTSKSAQAYLLFAKSSFHSLQQRNLRILKAVIHQLVGVGRQLLCVDDHLAAGAVIIAAHPNGDVLQGS